MRISFETFNNIPWKSIFTFFKWLLIVLDIGIAIGLVYVFKQSLRFRPDLRIGKKKTKKRTLQTDVLQKKWAGIMQKAESAPPQSFILAIIEADKFTDDVLKQLGFSGEHMADRLAHLNEGDMKTLRKLWQVHRIRNELAHTPDFVISQADAKEILEVYEAFLKEMMVLQ